MKKIFLLTLLFLGLANLLSAQDDELPPPSSRTKVDTLSKDEKVPPDAKDFKGFKPKKKVDISKFIIEPNFNLSIAQSLIDVGLSPYVGYNVWKGLCVGGGATYRFTRISVATEPDLVTGEVYFGKGRSHVYGGGVFLQYNIWKGFFARTKFEVLHRSGDDLIQQHVSIYKHSNGSYDMVFPKMNKTIPALLLGVGYNLVRSKNFFLPLMVSYDVLHSVVDKQYSLYRNGLVVQLGFVNIF